VNTGRCFFGKLSNRNSQTIDFFYDDFIWSDSAYPGVGQCSVLLPEAAGTYQTWTRGGTDTGANWSQVNELPPNGNTTYLVSPLVLNDAETEDVQTSGTVGITGTVNSVKAESIFAQNVAGGTVQLRLRSASTDNNTSNYTTTASYVAIEKIYDTDPATSSAWTLGGIDGLECGALDTNAANQVRMTWTGVMVDYTPPSTTTNSGFFRLLRG